MSEDEEGETRVTDRSRMKSYSGTSRLSQDESCEGETSRQNGIIKQNFFFSPSVDTPKKNFFFGLRVNTTGFFFFAEDAKTRRRSCT